MADALCGPANPLQQFKQQTSLDRTLQQDRLASRHSPAQGFRSHDPNAGLLDPEFEAFQAGFPTPDLPQYQPFPHVPASRSAGPALGSPSWATDFQRMQISPQMPQQQHLQQPSVATANSSQGFREHIAQNAPRAQHTSPSPQAFQQRARFGPSGFQNTFQPAFAPNVQQSKGKAPVTDDFDAAAFELAFDQARADLSADADRMQEEQEGPVDNDTLGKGAVSMQEVFDQVERLQSSDRPFASVEDQSRLDQSLNLGDDSMNLDLANLDSGDVLDSCEPEIFLQPNTSNTEEDARRKQANDDDALAATAHELLEKIDHNKTDKFRNSQFLSLMRKLRDREMKVEGDHMVEINGTATSTTANPLSGTAGADVPMFDNSEQRPAPLANNTLPGAVDIRPPEYVNAYVESGSGTGDYLPKYMVDPRDGQEVVDLLNGRGPLSDDIDSEFMMTSPFYQQ